MGRLGAILGASWAVLDAARTKQANMPEMYVFRKEWGDFCFVGVLLGASWGVLGASGPSCSHLRPSVSALGPSWGPFWSSLRPSWRYLRLSGRSETLCASLQGAGGGELGGRSSAGDRGHATGPATWDLVFGAIFCLEGQKRRDLVIKMSAAWARCVGGP